MSPAVSHISKKEWPPGFMGLPNVTWGKASPGVELIRVCESRRYRTKPNWIWKGISSHGGVSTILKREENIYLKMMMRINSADLPDQVQPWDSDQFFLLESPANNEKRAQGDEKCWENNTNRASCESGMKLGYSFSMYRIRLSSGISKADLGRSLKKLVPESIHAMGWCNNALYIVEELPLDFSHLLPVWQSLNLILNAITPI